MGTLLEPSISNDSVVVHIRDYLQQIRVVWEGNDRTGGDPAVEGVDNGRNAIRR